MLVLNKFVKTIITAAHAHKLFLTTPIQTTILVLIMDITHLILSKSLTAIMLWINIADIFKRCLLTTFLRTNFHPAMLMPVEQQTMDQSSFTSEREKSSMPTISWTRLKVLIMVDQAISQAITLLLNHPTISRREKKQSIMMRTFSPHYQGPNMDSIV